MIPCLFADIKPSSSSADLSGMIPLHIPPAHFRIARLRVVMGEKGKEKFYFRQPRSLLHEIPCFPWTTKMPVCFNEKCKFR